MAEYSGNEAVPGGVIGSGEAQVFNPMPTLQVLGGFQNRADARAKMEALERIKAAQPKKETPIEYPEFDVKARGGLFESKFAEDRQKMHLAGIDAVRQAKGDPYATAMITSKINNEIAGRSAVLEEQKARFYKTAEELKAQGYNFDPDREAYELTYDGGNYLDPTLNVKLLEKVKTNPRNFNFAQVGDEAEKIAGKTKRKVTYSDNTSREEEMPVFMRPSKKNPFVREISVKDAVPVLLQTPGGRQQFPILVTESLKEQKVDPAVIEGKDIEDLTAIQKQALFKAQEDAVRKYFAGRGDYAIVQDFTTDESKARGAAEGARKAGYKIGETGTNALVIRNQRGQVLESYIPNSTPLVSWDKPVAIPAGITVYPTGYYSDATGQTAQGIAGTNAKVVKQNVASKNFIEATGIPIARERVQIFVKDGGSKFVEKGEVIADAINDPSILKSIPGLYEKRNGYFAAPDDSQLRAEEDPVTGEIIYRRSGPNSTSLLGTVFIPEESAGFIRTHFDRKAKKPAGKSRIGSKKY